MCFLYKKILFWWGKNAKTHFVAVSYPLEKEKNVKKMNFAVIFNLHKFSDEFTNVDLKTTTNCFCHWYF